MAPMFAGVVCFTNNFDQTTFTILKFRTRLQKKLQNKQSRAFDLNNSHFNVADFRI